MFNSKAWHYHLINLVLIFERWDWLVVCEVIHILGSKLLVLHLVAVLIHGLHAAHEVLLGTDILRSCESEVAHALSLTQHGCISLLHHSRLSHSRDGEGILSARNEIASHAGTCLQERTVLFSCQL